MVDGAPNTIKKDIKMEEAEELKAKLEALGATIEIDCPTRPHGRASISKALFPKFQFISPARVCLFNPIAAD
eukprot:scaffold1031_cov234-Chaetoceros_neogracile.AAC.1